MSAPIRILIASSANAERAALQSEMQGFPDIKVVALSGDIFSALDAVNQVKPNVMILDLEMPGGGSLALLHKIMKSQPIPIIALFSGGPDGQVAAAQALAVGAADTQVKRSGSASMGEMAEELAMRVFQVAKGDQRSTWGPAREVPPVTRRKSTAVRSSQPPVLAATRSPQLARRAQEGGSTKIIVIGASTGGTQALSKVLEPLPADLPGIAIVQHMPPDFTGRLAERLNGRCDMTVLEAVDGMPFESGHAYIAPGGLQFALKKKGAELRIALSDGPLVGGHKPAVEHLFDSVTRCVGVQTMAIMLTGMGSDGCQAMKALHEQGALTIAQDEASCVVFGMPREAIRMGAASQVLALHEISQRIEAFGVEKISSRGAA